VGVVGAGAWGRNHVGTVAGLAEAELAAVCDTDPKVREKVARQYPSALVTADVAALLGAVDAVIVASPAATHATIAEQAGEDGKSYLHPAIEDVVFLTMEFASGVLAHVQLSWLDPHKERKLTVVGAKKMVVFDDMEPREKLRIYDKGVDRPPEYGSFGESLAIREGDIFIPKI